MTEANPPASRHHLGGHRHLGFAILSVSDTHTEEDDPSGHLARRMIQEAGHTVARYQLVANSVADVRDALEPWLADPKVECALTIGGTGVSSRDRSIAALEAMGGSKIEGFGEIYRALSFQEVGPLALMSRANLYVIQGKPVFALPGSERAVRTATERLILPVAQHLVEELER
ncbi:MAG: MogA/MoaB family molybdenum cofactor biosynthesis protein [Thermoplasmata archaeon]